MRANRLSSLEDKVLIGFLIFLFVASLGLAIYSGLTGAEVSPSWNVPVVLAALYTIVRLVGPVPEIRTDVRYLREVASVRVERMANVKDFYDSLSKAVDKATSTLDLTHIRDSPPEDFGEGAGAFFNKLVDWCAPDGRSIRRIICVRTPAMFVWAKQLEEDTRHMHQFDLRVIDWSPSAPAMNMAIVDGKATYLALTGSTVERTRGIGVEDDIATRYFADYYENLWNSSTNLSDWLRDNPWEGA